MAAEAPTLLFENASDHDIKVVAPGIAFILPAGSNPIIITQEGSNQRDVQLNIWWKHNPLELCQILTPWSRQVIVNGKNTIICRSKNR